ncbi:MAG: 3-oxoacyl-ACP reductase FabG [Bacilli bacterium]|nr:3-oxoacyl-ACP reductase FabG [Bacilli bacterium]
MNKVVLITGASRGIGARIAEIFAKNEFSVVINYNSSQKEAKNIEKKLKEKYNANILIIKADISKEIEVKNMIDQTIRRFGRIDVLVNNAGVAIDKDFQDRTITDFQNTFEVNVYGTFLVSKYVSTHMLKQKKGKIINISSTNGIDTLYPTSIDYDASKSAVISLTKNMALEFAPYINVNAVAPGWVNTDMNKKLPKDFLDLEKENILLKRFAKLEEIAKAVFFLANEKSGYINGEIVRVDGGMLL